MALARKTGSNPRDRPRSSPPAIVRTKSESKNICNVSAGPSTSMRSRCWLKDVTMLPVSGVLRVGRSAPFCVSTSLADKWKISRKMPDALSSTLAPWCRKRTTAALAPWGALTQRRRKGGPGCSAISSSAWIVTSPAPPKSSYGLGRMRLCGADCHIPRKLLFFSWHQVWCSKLSVEECQPTSGEQVVADRHFRPQHAPSHRPRGPSSPAPRCVPRLFRAVN
jgi:hypothetical protein